MTIVHLTHMAAWKEDNPHWSVHTYLTAQLHLDSLGEFYETKYNELMSYRVGTWREVGKYRSFK